MKKRLFSLLLAFVITFSNMETAFAAVEEPIDQAVSVSEDNDQSEICVEEDEQPEISDGVEVINVNEEKDSEGSNGNEEDIFPTGYNYIPGEEDVESITDIGDGAEDSFYALNLSDPLPSSYTTPSSYLPPLRNQGIYGTCWAHSSMATAEISMLKQGLCSSPDFSELHLAYFTYNTPSDPTGRMSGDVNEGIYDDDSPNFLDRGGNQEFASKVLASWVGAADETVAPYSTAGTVISTGLSDNIAFTDAAHLKNYYKVNTSTDEDRTAIKRMVKDLGAAGVAFYSLQEYQYVTFSDGGRVDFANAYSSTNNCYYFPHDVNTTNHAVTIVGWDDNFPAGNFSSTPEGNGAWLIRNNWYDSWEYENSYSGYFWLSYYDKGLKKSAAWGYEYERSNNYDHNYQYDGGFETFYPLLSIDKLMVANVYKVSSNAGNERLKAVSFLTGNTNLEYEVQIYMNPSDSNDPTSGVLASTVTGTTSYEGYYTVPLTEDVYLSPTDVFSVVITFTKNGDQIKTMTERTRQADWYKTSVKANAGESFVNLFSKYSDGIVRPRGWDDVTNTNGIGNVRIKAFTVDDSTSRCSITFDANGGKFASEATTQTKKYVYNAPLGELPIPVKEGYSFDGWYTNTSGGSKISASTTASGNTTYYAHWTAKTYTLTLNGNGGKIGSSTSTTMTATYGQAYGTLPTPVRDGYSFAGWFSTSSATGGDEITAQTKHMQDSNRTVYARWTSSGVMVTLDANEGECTTGTISVTYNGSYGTLPTPTRIGYDFGGWYTAKTSGTKVTSTTKVTNSKPHTLYAHWTAKTYTLTLNGNGGKIGSSTSTTMTATYGQAYGTLPTPVRDGYSFVGWFSTSSATGGDEITAQTKHMQDSNRTVYARWTNAEITVTLNPNEGECDTGSISVIYGEIYNDLPTPTRMGYEFFGWYTAKTGGTLVTSMTKVTNSSPHTLYAHWDPIKCSVKFEANKGKCEVTEKSVFYDSLYGDLPIPEYEGHQFVGWFLEDTFKTVVNASTVVKTYTDHTLYAKWIAGKYIVKFDLNGKPGVAPIPQEIEEGKTVIIPSDPEAEGFEFTGWFSDSDCKTEYDFAAPVDRNIILYAGWKEVEKYTIVYNSNGALGSVPIDENEYKKDDIAVILQPGSMIKEGYTFIGWSEDPNGKGAIYHPGDKVKIDKNIILYACWNKDAEQVQQTIVAGQKINLRDTCFFDVSDTISRYTVTDKSIASVSKETLIGKKAGTVKVYAEKMISRNNYEIIAECEVTVLNKPQLKFTRNMSYIGHKMDGNYYFKTDDIRAYGATSWESAKPGIIEVVDSSKGTLQAKSAGTAKITAYFGEKGKPGTYKVSANLMVKIPLFAKKDYSMQTGGKLTISMKNVTGAENPGWLIGNDSIAMATAQVDRKGINTGKVIVEGLNYGDTKLTAVVDGQEYECIIHVTAPEINKKAMTIKVGKTGTVSLKKTKIKKNNVIWQSENPLIAIVDANGKITAISSGTTVIYTNTGGIRNECYVTVP